MEGGPHQILRFSCRRTGVGHVCHLPAVASSL